MKETNFIGFDDLLLMVVKEGVAESAILLTWVTGVNRNNTISESKCKQKKGLWKMLTSLFI